jgi:signal transduction histidine kinase
LETALRTRLESYADCTGISVTLDASGLGRLPSDLELTIFRVVEEALANVKQHSGSITAHVGLQRSSAGGDVVTVSIEDTGRGMPSMVSVGAQIQRLTTTTAGWGLGLARMRERVHRMGGTLEITSVRRRTTVRASIPIRQKEVHSLL